MKSRLLLFNSHLYGDLLRGHSLSILDGGARGELFEPVRQIKKNSLFVLRFDPDPDAQVDNATSGVTFHAALWKRSEAIHLHIASDPSTSSIFPPDGELLCRFDDRFGYPIRRTMRIVDVQGEALDDILSRHPEYPRIDMIKLDIHGTEYEALEGAEQSLQHALAVAVETWTLPIHRGQRTHADVESLLYRHGFRLFHSERVAAMDRKNPWNVESRAQVVGYDNLYFRDFLGLKDINRPQALKAIALAEIYGHVTHALELVEHFAGGLITRSESDAIASELISSHPIPTRWQTFVRRVVRKAISLVK